MISTAKDDLQKAETAVLRMADDQYRKAIFNAQLAMNTGGKRTDGIYPLLSSAALADIVSLFVSIEGFPEIKEMSPVQYRTHSLII